MRTERYKHITWQLLAVLSLLLLSSAFAVLQGEFLGWIGILINAVTLAFLILNLPSAVDVIRSWAVLLMLPGIVFWCLTVLVLLTEQSPVERVMDRLFTVPAFLKNALLIYGIVFAIHAKGAVAYWKSRTVGRAA